MDTNSFVLFWLAICAVLCLVCVLIPRKKKPQPQTPHDCTTCVHYCQNKTPDALLPDKTIVHGAIYKRWCDKGKFDLHDFEPCEFYEDRGNRVPRIAIVPPPPVPPKKR